MHDQGRTRGEGGREGQYARCWDEGWCTVSGPFVAVRRKAERPVTTKEHAGMNNTIAQLAYLVLVVLENQDGTSGIAIRRHEHEALMKDTG